MKNALQLLHSSNSIKHYAIDPILSFLDMMVSTCSPDNEEENNGMYDECINMVDFV